MQNGTLSAEETMAIQSKRVKASGFGKTGKPMKEGYAAGRVPEVMRPTKAGKTNKVPYSGPNVAQADRG